MDDPHHGGESHVPKPRPRHVGKDLVVHGAEDHAVQVLLLGIVEEFFVRRGAVQEELRCRLGDLLDA
uniref:hypothetical protein n=1 Tax=Streptomyces brasiliscabiei TaxID=2736302 RepID=UPI0038F6BB66